MDVHKSSLLAVFDVKQRLEVPLFQRQYVWNEEQQWLPLWEDIERKFSEALEGRADAPLHFLGAMVLDQKHTPTGHVVVRQVIDGQQRLTTFQIFLSAFRDFCKEHNCLALASECDKFLFNTGMMADENVDKFKVWPTQLDRPQFIDVVTSGSRKELEKRHPLRKRPYARKPEPRPKMVEAYLFFFNQISQFFLGTEEDKPLANDYPITSRLDECFQTLRNNLMIVVIDLQKDDDPQVIFETLNARGEPLLPADLLRNYIFLRAGREGLDVERIYEKYWSGFDSDFWREEVKQGRLYRPRSDLFMQHFLASHQGQDIPIKHLYVEYRHWLEREKPFQDVTEELAALARQGHHFKRIINPEKSDRLYRISHFLETYDIRTAYPLLLAFMDAGLTDQEWGEVSNVLEAYLLRRAICNLGTKNYNKTFLSLTRNLRKSSFNAAQLRHQLLELTGEWSRWPDDGEFLTAWVNSPMYRVLNNPKLVYLFTRLNRTYMSPKSEEIEFSAPLTIEHIMPQSWEEHWLLPNGEKGIDDFVELHTADISDPRASATRKRNNVIHTVGNLTILSSALNSAQSNSAWIEKRPEMANHSLLPINQRVLTTMAWDEDSILTRGNELFEKAIRIWPR